MISFISVAFCSREKWASSRTGKTRVFIKSEWIVFIGERHTLRSPRCAYVAGVLGSSCRVALYLRGSLPPSPPPPCLFSFLFCVCVCERGVGWTGGGDTVLMLKCCFTSTETVGLLGTGARDGHRHFNTAPEHCLYFRVTTYNDNNNEIFTKCEPLTEVGVL